MTRYRLNTRFLVRTGLAFLVLATATHLLHLWQMGRHARGQVVRADRAQREGEARETVASLGRALVFRPNDRAVRTRYGMLLAKEARSPRGRWQALQILRGLLPRTGGSLEVRLQAVDLALSLNEPTEARKLLQPALDAQPDRADLRVRLAQVQIAAREYPAAADSLEQAVTLAPADVDCAVRLARLYRVELNNPDSARVVLNRLVRDNPRLAGAYLARAHALIDEDRLELAVADLDTARRLAPLDVDLLAASAALAQRRGQFAQACAWWRQAMVLAPNRTDLVFGFVGAERERGRTAQAIRSVRAALAHRSDDHDLRFILADLLIDQGEQEEAQRILRRLPATATGRKRYLQGRLALASGRCGGAVLALDQAEKAGDLGDEERCRVLLALVRAHAALGAREDQLQAASRASLLTSSPTTRLELARVYVSAGRSSEVLAELRRLAALPAPPDGVWNLLARALIEESGKRPGWQRNQEEAERALAQAEQIPAEAVTATLLRADLLVLRDEADEAWHVLERARQDSPDEPALWKAQARLAAREGDTRLVRDLLAAADRRFANRLDYLLERTQQLAGERGSLTVNELSALERNATRLSVADRDRLARHLIELYARLGYAAGVERLAVRLIEKHPKEVRPRLLLLEVKMAKGDERGVARLLAGLEKLEGPVGLQWRCGRASWLLKRAGSRERSELVEARKLLLEAQQLHPTAAGPSLLLGRLADLEGQSDQALPCYLRVLELGDYQPLVVRRAVALLLATGRYRDADRVLEQADRRGVLARDLWRPAAEVALRSGHPDRACRLARQAVSASRRSASDLLWLGRILDAGGSYTEAGQVFEEAIRQTPNVAEPWLALLAHRVQLKQFDQLEGCLADMREHLGASRWPLAEARAHEILGADAEAARGYRRLLENDDRDVEALSRLAALYLRTDQPDKAEPLLFSLLERGVLAEEDHPGVRRQLALALVRPGQKQDRLAEALTLLEMNRLQEGDTVADRRVTALVKGTQPRQRAEALRTLQELPGGTAVLPQERLCLARLYAAAGNWPKAREQYQALVSSDPGNATWLALLVEGLLRAGRKAEAGRWLAELEKREPLAERTTRLREQLSKAG